MSRAISAKKTYWNFSETKTTVHREVRTLFQHVVLIDKYERAQRLLHRVRLAHRTEEALGDGERRRPPGAVRVGVVANRREAEGVGRLGGVGVGLAVEELAELFAGDGLAVRLL